MREIQTATIGKTETESDLVKPESLSAIGLAEQINGLHENAEAYRDNAVSNAGLACRAAIQCGQLLIKAKEENSGDFLLWRESNCPKISMRTAQRYMKVATKYATALSDGLLDYQTLKDLYIATGIMPEPETEQSESIAQELPVWARLTTKLDAIIETLKGDDRERFRQWCQLVLERL